MALYLQIMLCVYRPDLFHLSNTLNTLFIPESFAEVLTHSQGCVLTHLVFLLFVFPPQAHFSILGLN